MIDLLRRELADLEYLSPEQQEELALFIAALRLERESVTSEPPSDPKRLTCGETRREPGAICRRTMRRRRSTACATRPAQYAR